MKVARERILVRGGRRSGKTRRCAQLAFDDLLSNRHVTYMADNTENLLGFRIALKNLMVDNKIVTGRKDTILTLVGRAEGFLCGRATDTLILDEADRMSPAIWEVIGAPLVMERNGKVIFTAGEDSSWVTELADNHLWTVQSASKIWRNSK